MVPFVGDNLNLFAPAPGPAAVPYSQLYDPNIDEVDECDERPGDLSFLSGRVRRYPSLANQPDATWDVLRVPSWIAVSRDEATTYAQSADDRTLFAPIDP